MNRLLLILVVFLVPFVILTMPLLDTELAYEDEQKSISLEMPVKENDDKKDEKDLTRQVLISNNKDKSEAYYIDLEEYVLGVVAGEMPASFSMEALKAQAIASRSYALNKMESIEGYVLSTTINDQVYLTEDNLKSRWGSDYDYYYNRVKKAVDETKGQVLTFDGKVISAYYFAISNGYTEDAKTVFNEQKEYLVSVKSDWDKNYESYESTRTMAKATFCEKLNIDCTNGINLTKERRSDTGYVREITINNKKFTGIQVFNKLALKSTDFTITIDDEEINIKTLGFGHGVGMSQYGAQGMAREGYKAEDILKHYYKNTKITHI